MAIIEVKKQTVKIKNNYRQHLPQKISTFELIKKMFCVQDVLVNTKIELNLVTNP